MKGKSLLIGSLVLGLVVATVVILLARRSESA